MSAGRQADAASGFLRRWTPLQPPVECVIVVNSPRLRVTSLTETGIQVRQIDTGRNDPPQHLTQHGTDMRNSTAAAASTEAHPNPRPDLIRRGQLVHIDPRASERADSAEETADDLAAARGILLGVAAGGSFWIMLSFGVRALWGWLAV